MNHQEVDEGKKRRAVVRTVVALASAVTPAVLIPASPDRISLYINLGAPVSSSMWIGDAPGGDSTFSLVNAQRLVFDLHIDQHGDAVRKAWYLINSTSMNAIIIETFEEPCECV